MPKPKSKLNRVAQKIFKERRAGKKKLSSDIKKSSEEFSKLKESATNTDATTKAVLSKIKKQLYNNLVFY
jgi:hypothetical protein